MLNFLKHHWNRRDTFVAKWTAWHFGIALVVGICIAVFLVSLHTKQDTSRTANLREMAQNVDDVSNAPPGTKNIGGNFELTNQDGKVVHDAEYREKLMLVYFGYTYCPDMCPTGLQSMSLALNQLGLDAKKVAPLFITVDPTRDTVAKLKTYVSEFSPDIQGLTGNDRQIADVAAKYQVYYAKGEQVDEHDYVMDHSSLIYLMGKDGSFITTFPEDVAPETIVKAVKEKL
jgi:protein SCO1/2